MAHRDRRRDFEILRSELKNERQSFDSHWRDIGEYINPRRIQFTTTENNKGGKVSQKIIDSTATMASRTLASGMVSHVTSPARQWFKLSVPDARLRDNADVKDWLHTVTKRMAAVFLQSNLYNALPTLYGDMGDFGTSAMMLEEDFDKVIRLHTFPIGSYYLAINDKGLVDVFMREFRMTVRQLIQKFGKKNEDGTTDMSNFSDQVRGFAKSGQMDTWIHVMHIIQPNKRFNPKALTSKKYESVYYERGYGNTANDLNAQETGTYLSDKGYDYFPVLAPRWSRNGNDVYGTWSPGMAALGDVKSLQTMQKRKAQAVEKMVMPPMTAPPALKTAKTSILPGDITYVDERDGAFKPAHEVRVSVTELREDIREHHERIDKAYYVNLFLMLASLDRREITATEIHERKEEKLIALGPVLEQLNLELLDPLIDITFDIMLQMGLIPTPPDALSGAKLRIEYISILHQAQKLTALVGIQTLVRFTGEVAQFDPSVIDKLDRDQLIDEVADIVGAPPKVVVSDETVLAIRQQKAEQAAKAAQAAQLQAVAKSAKDLGGADTGEGTALGAMLQGAG